MGTSPENRPPRTQTQATQISAAARGKGSGCGKNEAVGRKATRVKQVQEEEEVGGLHHRPQRQLHGHTCASCMPLGLRVC
jgi:hypothetical protein